MGHHFLILPKILKQSLFIVLLCHAVKAKPQVSGDYRSKDPQSGSSPYYWETTANWEAYNGSSWIAATTAPTASNNVTIQIGNAITVSSSAAVCNSLTINGTLIFYNSSSILTVSGDFTNNGTFTRGLGTVVLAGNSNNIFGNTTFNNLTISGSYTLQNDISISGNTLHTAVFTNNGTFNTNSKTVTLGSIGSAFDQIITGSSITTFYKLEITVGSATAANTNTLNSDIIISNELLLNYSSSKYGGILTNGTHLTMASGSVIKRHGGSITNMPTFAGNVDVYYGYSTLTTGPELPPASSSSLRNFEIYYSGNVTLNADINAKGNIYISSGTLNVNNGSNNYNITVGGNWTNSGTFACGAGTITLNGTTSQNLTSGNGNFYNLTINKNSNSATLLDNCSVSNTLTLTNGIVNTGSNYIICTRTDMTTNICNSISCSNFQTNYASYINGNFRQYIAASGANEGYYLPVGSLSAYRLAKFISPSTAVSGVNYVDAYFMSSFFNTGNLDAAKAKDYSTIYSSISNNGIWHIQGDANPTGNTKYNVMLFFDGGKTNGNDFNLSDNTFEILKRISGSTSAADWEGDVNGSIIPANDAAGRKVSDGYVIRNNFNSFSEFGIAKADEPLPVRLLTFDVKLNNDFVDISWSTASEINSNYFIVQRSFDMNEITDIQEIKAAGTSNSIIDYETSDKNPLKKINYYRLKEVDFNGETTYSKWIAVNCNSSNNNINIFPSPAKDIINIELNNNFTSDIILKVLNITGKEVKNISTSSIFTNNNIYRLNIEQLKNGIYFIRVICEKYTIDKMFVKAE